MCLLQLYPGVWENVAFCELLRFDTHQVPLSEDDCALSSGYAAAMDAAMHGNHYGGGRLQDPEETTPSDVSERPSVEDVESDTGSTGALETRSLKDHRGDALMRCSLTSDSKQVTDEKH